MLFKELALKLLLHQDVNVISVDWGGGSASMYSTSAANTRLVGLEVANMIHFLKVSSNEKKFKTNRNALNICSILIFCLKSFTVFLLFFPDPPRCFN